MAEIYLDKYKVLVVFMDLEFLLVWSHLNLQTRLPHVVVLHTACSSEFYHLNYLSNYEYTEQKTIFLISLKVTMAAFFLPQVLFIYLFFC